MVADFLGILHQLINPYLEEQKQSKDLQSSSMTMGSRFWMGTSTSKARQLIGRVSVEGPEENSDLVPRQVAFASFLALSMMVSHVALERFAIESK